MNGCYKVTCRLVLVCQVLLILLLVLTDQLVLKVPAFQHLLEIQAALSHLLVQLGQVVHFLLEFQVLLSHHECLVDQQGLHYQDNGYST